MRNKLISARQEQKREKRLKNQHRIGGKPEYERLDGKLYRVEHKMMPVSELAKMPLFKDIHGDDATDMVEKRMAINLANTGHPNHHRTLDGTIVTPDYAVEELWANMPADDRERVSRKWEARISPYAPEAVPIDLHYYEKPEGKAVMEAYFNSIR